MRAFLYLQNVTTLKMEAEKCVGCGMCVTVCPHAVLSMHNGRAQITTKDACMECGACARNCPSGALSVQAGVGCAAAVINAAIGRKNSACCCVLDTPEKQGGGSPSHQGERGSTCC